MEDDLERCDERRFECRGKLARNRKHSPSSTLSIEVYIEGQLSGQVARIKTESDRYGDTIEPVLELAGGKLSDGIT